MEHTKTRPGGRVYAALALVLSVALVMLAPVGAGASVSAVVISDVEVYPTAHISTPVAQLSAGTNVIVESFDANWAQINLGGETGYVITGKLSFNAPTPTLNPPPQPVVTATVVNGPLNVHEAANLSAPVIAELPTGSRVQLAGYDANWATVILGSQVGYVVTSYLSVGSHPAPTTAPHPAPTAQPHLRVETAGANATISTTNRGPLNLRIHPDSRANVIDSFANGSRIKVMSQLEGWYYVQAGSATGYMVVEYVTLDEGVQVPGSQGIDGVVQNATDGEVLHLRKEPDAGSESLGEYHNGTYVGVLAVGAQWLHVTVDGQEGYMMAQYVHITTPNVTPDYTVTTTDDTAITLYERPTTDAMSLASIPDGATVTILIPQGDWYKVQYTAGNETQTGYVQSANLTAQTPYLDAMDQIPNG